MKRLPPGYQVELDEPEWFKEVNQLYGTQHTYFPRSITFEDIDKAIVNWFQTRDIYINDELIPVLYLTPEKWAEFKNNWKFTDGNANVKYPYITIRRSFAPRLGEPLRGRIPGAKFNSFRVPIYENNKVTHKHYNVPQPVKVDLEYEVRALTHYISDINIINEVLLRHFASLHSYLDIDKHYMPMVIDNVSDESDLDSIEDERVIHTLYSIIVHGYIINEDEFEEKLGVNKVVVSITEDTT